MKSVVGHPWRNQNPDHRTYGAPKKARTHAALYFLSRTQRRPHTRGHSRHINRRVSRKNRWVWQNALFCRLDTRVGGVPSRRPFTIYIVRTHARNHPLLTPTATRKHTHTRAALHNIIYRLQGIQITYQYFPVFPYLPYLPYLPYFLHRLHTNLKEGLSISSFSILQSSRLQQGCTDFPQM